MVPRRSVLFGAAAAPLLVHAQPSRLLLLGDTPPYTYMDAKKRPTGIAYDMAAEIAKELPWTLEPRLVPLVRGFVELKGSGPALLLPPARLPSREALMRWVTPLVPVRLMLFARADSPVDITTVEAARRLSIGTLSATGLDETFRVSGFDRLARLATNETAVRMLLARRFDAILTADCSVYYAMQQHGRDMSVLREGAVVRTTQLWLGASLDYPDTELQAWRTAAARAHSQGRLDRIAAGYGVPPVSGRMPS